MAKITYVKGDATEPQGDRLKIIVHICNDIGAWGAGFVMALSKKWPKTQDHYIQLCNEFTSRDKRVPLGNVQAMFVEEDIIVCNMISQSGIGTDNEGNPPIRYTALKDCLRKVCYSFLNSNPTIHMPRIGTGLAGGKWELVEPIIQEELVDKGLNVIVYDL